MGRFWLLAIAPGLIKTDFSSFFHENPDRMKAVQKTQPIPRIADPDEVGYMALYLASDNSTFIFGQVISHDGGWS